ncbi:MAG: hypothetical protein O7D95_03050 [Betaproteobacteria bacterium]|nr:hypothetical protein [Betaproteobacteria bacterium]
MIELRWKEYLHDVSKPTHAVRMMDRGRFPVCAVLQYREGSVPVRVGGAKISARTSPTKWKDVPIES